MTTPLTIQILIECVCCDKPGSNISENVWNSSAADDALNWLAREGLIDHMDYRATARGKAWLSFICQTPLPEQQWVLPKREALHDKGSE